MSTPCYLSNIVRLPDFDRRLHSCILHGWVEENLNSVQNESAAHPLCTRDYSQSLLVMQIWRVGIDYGIHRWHWTCNDHPISSKENKRGHCGPISFEARGVFQGALKQVQCSGGISILFPTRHPFSRRHLKHWCRHYLLPIPLLLFWDKLIWGYLGSWNQPVRHTFHTRATQLLSPTENIFVQKDII